MSKKAFRWCPNGCGKCVVYKYIYSEEVASIRKYKCDRCGNTWNNLNELLAASKINSK